MTTCIVASPYTAEFCEDHSVTATRAYPTLSYGVPMAVELVVVVEVASIYFTPPRHRDH